MKISSDYESPLVLEKIEITESTFRKKDVFCVGRGGSISTASF